MQSLPRSVLNRLRGSLAVIERDASGVTLQGSEPQRLSDRGLAKLHEDWQHMLSAHHHYKMSFIDHYLPLLMTWIGVEIPLEYDITGISFYQLQLSEAGDLNYIVRLTVSPRPIRY